MRPAIYFCIALLVVSGCSSSGADAESGSSPKPSGGVESTTNVAPLPPFEVTTTSETLVDSSRATNATASQPEKPSRTLVTTIIYPDAPGPFPLIVFSHGLTGSPDRHTELSSAWARQGYVVAMPKFPLTNAANPDAVSSAGDVANQPGDVSFVIDQMIAASADEDSPLHGKVMKDRIGVAGHSLGGATTYGVVQNDCCRDDRIDATIIMSGIMLLDPAGDHLDEMPPVMLMHGVADPLLDIAAADKIYPQLSAPKWYVRLLVAGHAEAYENTPSPSDEVVTAATTDFWHAYLPAKAGAPDPAILDRLRRHAVEEGISTLQSDPG
ncbi:MAG TPA: dienelactone hydrolase family protein [Microthrixaceae bacterium]|nr:dienelactone hydrolase family protein [Microthrixaceae bacterium]